MNLFIEVILALAGIAGFIAIGYWSYFSEKFEKKTKETGHQTASGEAVVTLDKTGNKE
ncbi:hypothetical protein [Priestia abyssalis]|uniref:hypothetical protein n=1 Tax=Priestia abyssalis TaxID=1221450 RepID=UPI0014766601|nr:hypothetical protein [Priestia abyssalis]